MDKTHSYVGTELDLFAEAANWKRYLRKQFATFIKGEVLEVGAGKGGTTRFLFADDCVHWTCLEPDPVLAGLILPEMMSTSPARVTSVSVLVGTVSDLGESSVYDTILYIDVLEHINNDAFELQEAARLLRDGGHLIVLSPAHQWLFSPFDTAIGHYRRYTRATLRSVTPQGLELKRLRYLDSVGLLASLGNRILLKADTPTSRQISVWNRLMVPVSGLLDPVFGYRVGKSVYAVWQRSANRSLSTIP